MRKLRVLDLFSGIGGFSLGLERAGMETIGFVERDEACIKVLLKHWPEAVISDDIKQISAEDFERPDVVCGGFPCQPFSSASHGVTVAEDLWPHMMRLVWQILPTYVIAENVSRKAIDIAKTDLEKIGYHCETRNISAAQCGADHQRSRWWLIAHPYNESELFSAIDAETSLLPKLCEGLWGSENYARTVRVSDGVSNRVDRLKQLGNSVIPYIPQAIATGIIKYEQGN